MALFWSAIKRDSISLFKFLFPNHIQVILREISLVCRLKYPYSYFFPHFCLLDFLFVVFLIDHNLILLIRIATINLSLPFFVNSLSSWIAGLILGVALSESRYI